MPSSPLLCVRMHTATYGHARRNVCCTTQGALRATTCTAPTRPAAICSLYYSMLCELHMIGCRQQCLHQSLLHTHFSLMCMPSKNYTLSSVHLYGSIPTGVSNPSPLVPGVMSYLLCHAFAHSRDCLHRDTKEDSTHICLNVSTAIMCRMT